jgi:pyrroloquinoline quinone (PQQ) biosynthesis protein C
VAAVEMLAASHVIELIAEVAITSVGEKVDEQFGKSEVDGDGKRADPAILNYFILTYRTDHDWSHTQGTILAALILLTILLQG